MSLAFEQAFTVLHSECDPWGRLFPGALLRRVQDISTAQCAGMGVDETLYNKTRTAFLLSRLSLHVRKMPRVNQRVRMETVALGMRRAVFHRVTTLYSETGETLCQTDTRWVLVDIDTHRILRKYPPEIAAFCDNVEGEGLHDMTLPKPGNLFTMQEAHATYTMCDANGHINNTRYADMICDHLPIARLQAAPPSSMLLFYRAEISLGSSYVLSGAQTDENQFYFLAEEAGVRNFECLVTF